MRSGEEFEEDGAVDGEVATDAHTPEGGKDADGGEVGGTGRDEAEDGGDADGEIESQPSTEDVTAKAPKDGPRQQADVLRERQQGRPAG